MPSQQRRPKRAFLEQLESKRLLAVDLQVAVDAYALEAPGETVSRYVRVFNNGDTDVDDVLIQSRVTDQLDDVTWTRESGYARVIHSRTYPQLTSDLSDSSIRDIDGTYFSAKTIGDVNGDSFVDFGASYFNETAFVVFGGQEHVILGGTQDLSLEDGSKALGFEIPIDNITSRFPEMEPLGDVNGDEIDDFVIGNVVVFGDREMHLRNEELSLPPIQSGNGFIVHTEDFLAINSPGDLNVDGFNDIVFSTEGKTAVIWGGSQLNTGNTISIDSILGDATQSTGLIISHDDLGSPVAIGDINGDGFKDVAFDRHGFDISVVLSSPKLKLTETDVQFWDWISRPNPGCNPSQVLPNAGDVNGDGINDLIVNGGDYCGLDTNPPSESLVVLGGTTGSAGELRFVGRTVTHTEDVNSDGILDLIFNGGNVIFGGEELSGRAFDEVGYNGMDGFRYNRGTHAKLLDLNSDGVADRFERLPNHAYGIALNNAAPNYPQLSINPSNGVGDIIESTLLPAGESFIYHVTGRVKPNAKPSFQTSAFPLSSPSDHNLRDNVDSIFRAVSLTMDAVRHPVQDGFAALDVTLRNDGPQTAQSVLIESIGDFNPAGVTWKTEMDSNFPSAPSEFLPDLGVALSADAGMSGVWYDDDGRSTEELGRDVGRLGDLNGDGFDEVFSTNQAGMRIFWGTELFGQGNRSDQRLAKEWSQLADVVHANALGDFNGDGLDDFFVVFAPPRSTNQTQYVILGQRDFPKSRTTNALGAIGIRSLREDRVSHVHMEAAGDVDGNGVVDFLLGDRLVLRDETNTNSEWYNRALDDSNSVRFSQRLPRPPFCISFYWCDSSEEAFQSAIGDVNNDGFDDIVVRDTIYLGGAHVTNGLWDATLAPSMLVTGAVQFAEGAHDVNGDGIDDLIFAARKLNSNQTQTVNVIFGKTELTPIELDQLDGSNGFAIKLTWPWDTFNFHDIQASDINGDGNSEILFLGRESGSQSGSSYVFFPDRRPSGGLMDLAELAQLHHESLLYSFATNMATEFDANGDGVNDVFWGAQPREDGGSIHVMLGRPTNTASGTGFLQEKIDIAPNSEVTFRIAIPATISDSIRFTATAPAPQVDIRSTDNTHSIEISLMSADLDGDGLVNYSDFLILAGNFGKSDAEVGDINANGTVDFADFLLLSSNFV